MGLTRTRAAAVALGVAAAVVCTFAAPAGAAKPPPEPPPPPSYSFAQCQPITVGELCVTVDPAGTANPDGSASVTITVTCTPVAGQTYYGNVRVWQDFAAHADQVLVGSPQAAFPCEGTPRAHVITTRPTGYHPGVARVIAQIGTQGPAGLTTVQVDTGDAVLLA